MLSRHDAAVVRRDRSLPHLGLLFDPARFAEKLSTTLPDLRLSDVRPTYVRYKPGMNCLVGFELDLEDGPVLAYAKTHGSDRTEKLAKARLRPEIPGPAGPGRLLWEELDTVVSFFPNDGKLRSLGDLMEGGADARVVRHLGLGSTEDDPRYERLAYKPERRYVVRTTLGGHPVVLKLYTPGRLPAAWAAGTHRAYEPFRLPRVRGRADRDDALAWEWLPGMALLDALRGDELDDVAIAWDARRVGLALGAFHLGLSTDLPTRTAAREVERTRRAAERAALLVPGLRNEIDRLLSALEAALPRVEAGPLSLIHGDFSSKQVVVGDAIGLIDLDRACRGGAAGDIACFLAHLDRDVDRGRFSASRADAAARGVVDGYVTARGRLPDHLEWHMAAALLQLAPDPFRRREPEWPGRTEAVVERAREWLREMPRPARPAPSPRSPAKRDASRRAEGSGVAHDPAIPFLEQALSVRTAGSALANGWTDDVEEPAALRVEDARLVRHKRGRRALIEYEVRLPESSAPLRVLGKIRAKGLDQRTPSLIQALHQLGFGMEATDGIHVPAPLGLVPEFQMWLQRRVVAEPVTDRWSGARALDLARRVARAIHKLHASPLAVARRHGTTDELAILTDRLGALRGREPARDRDLDRVLEGCRRLAEALPVAAPRLLHRDFYPDQILEADDGALYLVDLDLAAMGDPALDVGNFSAHLIEHSLRLSGDPTRLADVEESFVAEYRRLAPNTAPESIAIHTTLSLARHIYLSTRFEERRHTTDALIAICLDRLSGFVESAG